MENRKKSTVAKKDYLEKLAKQKTAFGHDMFTTKGTKNLKQSVLRSRKVQNEKKKTYRFTVVENLFALQLQQLGFERVQTMGTICKATSEILIVETKDFFIKELVGNLALKVNKHVLKRKAQRRMKQFKNLSSIIIEDHVKNPKPLYQICTQDADANNNRLMKTT